MCGQQPHHWFKWLPLAEWWYNTTYHTATQTTPFEALYEFPPLLHVPYMPHDSPMEAVNQLLTDREQFLVLLKANLRKARDRMK